MFSRLKSCALTCVSSAIVISSAASAATFTPIASYTLPAPSTISFSTSATFGPDGLMYAYDGQNVLRQSAINAATFSVISTSAAPVSGSDAGPIAFTQNGQTIVVGTGSGGMDFSGNSSGLFLTLPAAGGSFTGPLATSVPFQTTFKAVGTSSTLSNAANLLAVDLGNSSFNGSSVSYYDLTLAATNAPGANKTVISGIPGASTDVAYDSTGHFYVGVGFGTGRGDIRRFDASDLDNAYTTNTPLAFTSGTLLNPNNSNNNSGAGIFVADDYIFAGSGSDGGLITIAPDGLVQSFNLGKGFASILYNSTNDQLAVTDFDGSVDIYNAVTFIPEPSAVMMIVVIASGALLRRRGRRCA